MPPPPILARPPTGALPVPWTDGDIGTVGVAGSASLDDPTSTYTLKGAGADIWGTADALHYAYQTLSGDGTIVARVTWCPTMPPGSRPA